MKKKPQHCQSAQNQPKSHILFHKNGSLRDFYIMTLIRSYKKCQLRKMWSCMVIKNSRVVTFLRLSKVTENVKNKINAIFVINGVLASL